MSPIRDWLRTLDDDTIAQIIHAAELLAQEGPIYVGHWSAR